MRFDNVLHVLMDWCAKRSKEASVAYLKNRTLLGHVPYQVMDELRFKLASQVGREFVSFEALKERIRCELDVHYDPSLKQSHNRIQSRMVQQTQNAFIQYLNTCSPEDSTNNPAYWRVIQGGEAAVLLERFRTVWEYDSRDYWYPLSQAGPGEKLFLMEDLVEQKEEALLTLLRLPEQHMYCCEEKLYPVDAVQETNEFSFYGGLEKAYTDKDFAWMIYCSHEQTVTFAGSILPQIKELFKEEKDHWNRFEWNF